MPRGATPASWNPERKMAMSNWMHKHKPWESSTGARTAKGKANSAMRGLKHGKCSAPVRNAASVTHALNQMTKALLDE